jgi:hypothetical protein
MTPMQASGGSKGTVARAEHHRKYNVKGSMEATDWVCKGARVLGDSGGDPGMRQLKEQSTAGAQKDDCLSVDAPRHRGRTKNARNRSCRPSPDEIMRNL